MVKPQITKIEEVLDFTPAGTLAGYYKITWALGDQGPFTYQIPKSEFSVDKVRQELEKRAKDFYTLLEKRE